MLSCLGPVLRGGAKVTGEIRRLFSSFARRWGQFALGGVVEMERIECFWELFQWRNPKVLVVDWRDAAFIFHVEQQITTNLATQQHSFIVSWFPHVRSPGTEDWGLCSGLRTSVRCWLGLWSHQRISWEKVHFQTPSGAWQNSSSCNL